MTTRDTAWPAGTPCWVDCGFEDLDRARTLYGHLFGWDVEPGTPESGDYTMCLKNGRPVAGITSSQDPAAPTSWSVHLASDDVDATVAAVERAGGRVVVPAADLPALGRTAVLQDPTGARFSVWQAQGHVGVQRFDEPGTVVWTDLMTRDLEAARAFYATVFGYTYQEMGPDYLTFTAPGGDRPAGGIHLAGELPADTPPHWLVHLGVADRDSTVALAEMEDGVDVLLTFDTPYGPEATVRGPEGEVFNVIGLGTDG